MYYGPMAMPGVVYYAKLPISVIPDILGTSRTTCDLMYIKAVGAVVYDWAGESACDFSA